MPKQTLLNNDLIVKSTNDHSSTVILERKRTDYQELMNASKTNKNE